MCYSEYGILTIEQIDELERYRAAYILHSKLQKGKRQFKHAYKKYATASILLLALWRI